jgi:ParB/RepB/Spo0J family partition protein
VNQLETVVEQIPLKAISVIANARSDMDAKKLEELKATIVTGGIRTPLILSPLKAGGVALTGKYRVVCGHRRFTAAKDLELATVPAIVRDLSDDEIEIEQLVENDAREDLTALDRAAQYKKLQERGLDAAAIAKRVGRARSTVELTLRLAELVPGARKALLAGWLPQGAAEELALLSPGVQGEGLKLLEQLEQGGELTRDRARELLRRELLLDLAEVKFDIRDPNLVPSAGACIPDCTKRTGAQLDLFGGGKGPDCCTDKPCLRIKEGAWLKLQEKAGRKVLSGAEVKSLFPYSNSRMGNHPTYALADEKDYYTGDGNKTYRQRLGKGKEVDAKLVLARAPSGELIELVDRKDLPKLTSSSSPAPKHVKSAGEKRRELEQKASREAVGRALTDVGQHLAGGDLGHYDADVAELVFRALLRESHKDTKVALAKLMLLEPAKGYDGADVALLGHYEATEKKRKHPGWDFVALLALAPALLTNPIYPDQGAINDLKKFIKLLGCGDFAKYRADVERELRNAEKAKAAKKGAKKSGGGRR